MAVLPMLVRAFEKRVGEHPVLVHLPGFLEHVRRRVYAQGRSLGFVPEARPGAAKRAWAMGYGLALFVRSQFARSTSKLEKIYIDELGLGDGGAPGGGSDALREPPAPEPESQSRPGTSAPSALS
jgi:hypothetical protein